eukprot:gene12884-7305_t
MRKLNSKKVNKENYIVNFEAALSKKEIAIVFENFLKSEFNQEPWLYLQQVKELHELKEENRIITKIESITENFLQKNSKNELNISYELQKKTLTLLKDLKEKKVEVQQAMDNLENIAETIRVQLRHDPWKRFYRSKSCEDIIQKYYNDSTVCSPATTVQYYYKDDHFEHPFIDDSDFEFGNNLFEDSYDWELVGSSEGLNSFFSSINYLPNLSNSKNVSAFKFQFNLPFSMHSCLLGAFTPASGKKIDPNLVKLVSDDYYSFERLKSHYKEKDEEQKIEKFERASCMVTEHVKVPFPMNSRYSKSTYSMTYDSKSKTFYAVSKSSSDSYSQFSKPHIAEVYDKSGNKSPRKSYLMFNFGFYQFQKVDEKNVLVTQVHLVDIGGNSQ